MTKRGMLLSGRLALPVVLLVPHIAFVPETAIAQAVVQPVPAAPAGLTLNAALARLARDPRDLAALIDAGNAALQMGDVDAAIGFFARADQLSPNNMRVKAGLAGALVRSENPYDAIPLFAEAERAGAVDPVLAVDRGLAYDLVGDTVSAQKYYRQALAAGPNDEAIRRLALSQAIAGDRKGMEATLSSLLQRQDKGAWRARAFALAILGAPEEGVAIANQVMPAELANGIAPYLRFMPRLTGAQQAAAANLGRFPRAADIGRDDPRVALYAPPRPVASSVGAALVPSGEPLGRRGARKAEQRPAQVAAAAPARLAPPEVAPTRSDLPAPRPAVANAAPTVSTAPVSAPAAQRPAVAVTASGPAPAWTDARPSAVAPIASAPAAPAPGPAPATPRPSSTPASTLAATTAPLAPAPTPAVRPAPTPATSSVVPTASSPSVADSPVRPAASVGPGLVPGGGFDLARVSPAPNPTSAPTAAPPPSQVSAAPVPASTVAAASRTSASPSLATKPRPRIADAFADLATVPKGAVAPAPGAVDVRKLAEARARAEAAKTPPKPAHPSRIWVQLGVGRDTGALGFTWRGLAKDNPALFKSQSPSMSDWGRTNRLLAGPFASEAAADAFLGRARKAGLDAFVWTSPAGQVVDPLPSR